MELLWGLNDVTCVKYWVWTEACEGLPECQLWAVRPLTTPWGRYCVIFILEMRKLKLRDERCKETCQGPRQHQSQDVNQVSLIQPTCCLIPLPAIAPFQNSLVSVTLGFILPYPTYHCEWWNTRKVILTSQRKPLICFVYEKPWSNQVRLSSLIKILGKVLWRLSKC